EEEKNLQASEEFSQNLIHELERLHQLRENFELLFADGSATSCQAPEEASAVEPVEPTEKSGLDEPQKSKKERIIELAKAASDETSVEPPRTRRRRKDAIDVLIDQIVTNKEEITPESEKQKEQIELINHFIR